MKKTILTTLRESKKISKEELASKIGVSGKEIIRYESNPDFIPIGLLSLTVKTLK